jgi:general secretion pathway protein C
VATRAVEPARWLIMFGIVYTLATSVLFFIADQPGSPAATAVQGSDGPTLPEVNLNEVLAANLFGSATPRAVTTEVQEQATTETRLPLILNGVFVAEHPDHSAAIIAQKGKTGVLYGIGDQVPGNATLHRVHTQHVVLRRAGALETLTFPEVRPTFRVDPHDDPGSRTARERSPSLAALPDAPPDDGPAPVESATERVVDTYRERLNSDPEGTLAELGLGRVSDSAAAGYRLDDLADNPYLRQTGLQPGDVILSVNGRPVGDIGADQQQIDSVLAEGSARLEVQRGDRRFFVTASLK